MGFEKSHLFGKVEVDIRTTSAGTIVFQTETPGGQLVQRFSMPIPVTTGRTVLRSRLPGTMQGHYVRSTGTPGNPGIWEVYGVRIWSRELPTGNWQWWPLPVMDTPVEYQQYIILADSTISQQGEEAFTEYKIPVEETPVQYVKFEVELVDTPVLYTKLDIEVEPTPVEFSPYKIAVDETPLEFSAWKVPIIATPEEYTELNLAVEPTPVEFAEFKFPVKATPPVPLWVSVAVDE